MFSVNTHLLPHGSEDLAPDRRELRRNRIPIRTVNAHLPAIDLIPGRTHPAKIQRPDPGFDGEDGVPFDIGNLIKQAEDATDCSVDSSPVLSSAAQREGSNGESDTQDSQRELAAQRIQMVTLQRAQQSQAIALRQARNLIESLQESLSLFRSGLVQREKEAQDVKQALRRSDEEKTGLRQQLERANANCAELLQQTTDLNAACNEREKQIEAVRKDLALLKTEAVAKSASEAELVAAIEQVKAHYDSEINKRCAQFEAHINKFAKMVGAREEQIKILQDENTKLTTRCQALAADVQALNSERWNAQEKVESEIAIIKLLNATLYAEREAAGQKIAALVGALEREREQHAAEARKSASVCKEIAMLLPKLMQQSNRLAK